MRTAHVVATDSNEKRIAGRYILGRPLGQGGMGVVAVARDERLNRDVAIKLLSASAIGGAVMRARLIREARALAALSHPGVVHVYDVGETDDGGAYLVMELVQGTSLGVLLKKRTTSRPEWLRIVADVARTLGAAHRAGFVHRDVKPDNIMLRDDGRVVVLDFGIAQRLAAEGAPDVDDLASDDMLGRLTVEGTLVGTPGYLAPEQALGAPVDGRADQFALGVLLYRSVTGRAPWRGREFKELVAQIVHSNPTPPSALAPGLPRALDALVARALAKLPAERFADMESFAAAIDEVIALGVPAGDEAVGNAEATVPGLPSVRPPPRSIAPQSSASPSVQAPPAGAEDEAPTVQSSRPRAPAVAPPAAPPRARRAMAAGLAGLASLLVAGFAYRAYHRPHATMPLDEPNATLACPLLEAHDASGEVGWLGAAAGATVCARARWLFGGDARHTLAPAALLGFARHPADTLPRDAYAAGTARRASLAAAAHASAYVDGDVACGDGCAVNLVVRAGAGGREMGRAAGRGVTLYEAVRQAMDALGRAGVLPRPRALDADAASWARVGSPAAALALEDLALSRVQGGGATAAECARVLGLGDAVRDVAREVRARCAMEAGTPGEGPVAVDRASPSALAHTAIAHVESAGRDDPAALAHEIHAAFAREHAPAGRALLARAEAETWLYAGEPARARDAALLSVETDPASNFAWQFLTSASAGQDGAGLTQRAYAAWFPESADAWTCSASAYDAAPGDLTFRLVAARRAVALRPQDPERVRRLAELQIDNGHPEEARVLSATLGEGDARSHAVADLLQLRLVASAGSLGAAFAQAQQSLAALPVFGRYPSDVELANEALRIAWILGRTSAAADAFVARFVDVDPPRISPLEPNVALNVIAACAVASAPASSRCFARLHAMLQQRVWDVGLIPRLDDALAGAERYAHHDARGAAAAWRSLVGLPGYTVFLLEDPMAQTFDDVHQPDLATQVDGDSVHHPGEYHGANLAYARAARRAAARGNDAEARALAQHVVQAWSTADVPVPVVAEMQSLLQTLR